jgi:hypothetical protein
MSVKRRINWVSQGRVDLPDIKSLESAVSNDFDELIKSFVTGTSQGYILRGFEISMAGAIGGAASGLQLLVDPGAVFHIASSQSGTVFLVPPGTPSQQLNSATNVIVDGAFAPNAINYVGLEYERFIDNSTSAQTYIWVPTTKNETIKSLPKAQILRYRIKITTSTFASNVLPIATVTTDSGNNVVSITDARWLLFRLGQGGASPNPFYQYPWTAQPEGRLENPSTSSSNSSNPFRGGDKMLGSLKDLLDALMTSIKEIKGTTYWYSSSSAGSIESLREDLGNTITTGKGSITHSATVAGQINWSDDIYLRVIGTSLSYKILANNLSSDIILGDDQVAYINLVRDVAISPNLIFTNGSAVVQSVGSIAWTGSLQAGDWVKLSSDTVSGYYKILTVDSLSQVTLTSVYIGLSTGASGAKGKYSFGTYQAAAVPSSSRDIVIANRQSVPLGQDIFWLFVRSDNTGIIPKVYIRFMGSELEQGETEEIDDGTSKQILQYIGAPLESSYAPQYVATVNPGAVPEITDFKFGAASTINSGEYFYLNSSADSRKYYVWFKKDGIGTDPMPAAERMGVEVDISTGQTAIQVASLFLTAITTTFFADFSAVQLSNPNDDTIRVTNNSSGVTSDAYNVNVSAPFTVTVFQQGTGDGNYIVNDGDNLTLAIKKLDKAFGLILTSLDDPSYDEPVTIVASGATPPTSLNGPILSGTVITLPNNSRMGNIPQNYTVGKGSLQVYWNGQYLLLGDGWSEVGASGTASAQITILVDLFVGDILEFRISAGGAGAGGGGGTGPQGPAGPPGVPGADAIGGPVAISTKTSNYAVLNSDNVLLADCSSGSVTFTLPSPASAVGQVFFFKKIDSSANPMQLIVSGGANIDGVPMQSTVVQYESFNAITDGSVYWLL